MKQNRKNNVKRERIIMWTSSILVLAALTTTGIYMRGRNVESKDDGYTIDFTALEELPTTEPLGLSQIAQNLTEETKKEDALQVTEDDLDYMPLEVGSGLVENPGLLNEKEKLEKKGKATPKTLEKTALPEDKKVEEELVVEEMAKEVAVSRELHFSEESTLVRPLQGEVILPFCMDSSIYFPTLDQYKYNPAMVISAEKGMEVLACAEGCVTDIYRDAQLGQVLVLDLGDGYEAVYGQLEEIPVSVGSYVDAGQVLGNVAEPTKYFSLEGSNLSFAIKKDGKAVDPQDWF